MASRSGHRRRNFAHLRGLFVGRPVGTYLPARQSTSGHLFLPAASLDSLMGGCAKSSSNRQGDGTYMPLSYLVPFDLSPPPPPLPLFSCTCTGAPSLLANQLQPNPALEPTFFYFTESGESYIWLTLLIAAPCHVSSLPLYPENTIERAFLSHLRQKFDS